jgi:hypothetical protein
MIHNLLVVVMEYINKGTILGMGEHVRELRTLVLKTNIELKIFFNVF